MELEQDAQVVITDAEKAWGFVKQAGVFAVLKTATIKGLTSVPSLMISAGTLLMPTSLAFRGIMTLVSIGLIFGVYIQGKHDADVACQAREAKAIEKNIKSYGKIKNKTSKMGKSQLDSSLSKWVR